MAGLEKNSFIEMLKRMFEEKMDAKVSYLVETKFVRFKDTDSRGRDVIIRGYKFTPFPPPRNDLYAVKFSVSVDGYVGKKYMVRESEGFTFGLTDNVDPDKEPEIMEKIDAFLDMISKD